MLCSNAFTKMFQQIGFEFSSSYKMQNSLTSLNKIEGKKDITVPIVRFFLKKCQTKLKSVLSNISNIF